MNRNVLRIVIVGRNGQVAWELGQVLPRLGSVTCVGRPELDLTDLASIRAAIRPLCADVVVNAAAYTAVDQAESDPETAKKANAEAPRVLAEEAKRQGALFITYSSDYVFDGEKSTPYVESDMPCPLNVYGATKLAGDRAVEDVGGGYLILRTSWVYGVRGKNFLNTILNLADEREELSIVDDQIGAPTWSREIAKATAQIIAQLVKSSARNGNRLVEELDGRRGIYNMTAGGSVSWHGFAKAIIREMDQRCPPGRSVRIVPIAASQYPLPARRPKSSRLSNEHLQQVFGLSLPDWKDSLAAVIDEVAYARNRNRDETATEIK